MGSKIIMLSMYGEQDIELIIMQSMSMYGEQDIELIIIIYVRGARY